MSGSPKTGQYVLLERVGMGGMAEVFRAASVGVEGFERPVAIKRILPNLTADHEFVKMFVDEAKIAVQLQHPNIVAIFDLAREDEDLFITMEYVHGKDLRAILDKVQGKDGREGRLPIEVAVHTTMKVADALHHAHFAHGPTGQPLHIIHRDISPQNVLMSFDGEVKVTDFGLAKAAGRAVQTQVGVVKGKLAYMSPEQLRGQALDYRSDIYGLGVLLWEMLTGVRLFLGRNEQETLRKVYEGKVPRPSALRPEVHPELEAIVMRALAAEPGERFATAEEMQEELTSFSYAVGPSINRNGMAAFMRRLFPSAEPTISSAPPPPAHNPHTLMPPHRQPAPPPKMRVGGGDPDTTTNAKPRVTRAPMPPSPPANLPPPPPPGMLQGPPVRPTPISTPRGPISLDDLEDLAEVDEASQTARPASRAERVTMSRAGAPRPQSRPQSNPLVRSVLEKAIASSNIETARSRPPPPMFDDEEETTVGQLAAYVPARPRVGQEDSVTTTAQTPQVFRRPGRAADPAPATLPPMQDIAPVAHTPVPSIEALIEEALHEPIEFFHPEDAPSGDFTDDEDFEDQPTDIGRLEDFGVDPYRPKR
jgi:serine/threonine-protein kinase